MESCFYRNQKQYLSAFLNSEKARIGGDCISIDLHCHDHNSDVPDETLGRILGVPETWLPTQDLLKTLRSAGAQAITITNHNNARSCFELLDQGHDVLVGAEFSCMVPDLNIGIHVLTYGFTPHEEVRLNALRRDLYKFLAFTTERNLPTIWAHPLNFHAPHRVPSPAELDKLILCFERFEGINGQRNSWQNLLTIDWVRSATPEKIEAISRRTGLSATEFCKSPDWKRVTGGSDDHFGVFAGTTGTLIRVPNLQERLRERQKSDVVLEALRTSELAPFGGWNDGEKLSLALLDYITSVALKMEDPGLGRILLHKGTANEKLIALGVSNAIHELRRHKFTMRFLKAFHLALRGERPNMIMRFLMKRKYPRFLSLAESFASGSKNIRSGAHPKDVLNAQFLFRAFSELALERSLEHVKKIEERLAIGASGFDEVLAELEMPSVLRELVEPSSAFAKRSPRYRKATFSLGRALDSLSFPYLAAGVVLTAAFASAKVLHKERKFLNTLAQDFPHLNPPERLLWITDTFGDKNGVSRVLEQVLEYAKTHDAPIDLMVCNSKYSSQNHFISIDPLGEFTFKTYPHQPFRVPDVLEIQKVFDEGGYTQVMCSTEGPMLFAALFLKYAHNVPVHFFVHTDWLAFCRDTLKLSEVQCDRARRLLRSIYSRFDSIFVLNSEQKRLFSGQEFQIPESRVHQTAHWADSVFRVIDKGYSEKRRSPMLLFAGRISAEKGVFELPEIFLAAKAVRGDVRMCVVGTGPDEQKLKQQLPEAEFLGWKTSEELCAIYNEASLLLLPSKFDTFGCVVLEAMACGLPVAAYACKGPADIIEHGINGFLSDNRLEMSIQVARFVSNHERDEEMRVSAIRRAAMYTPEKIMGKLLTDVGIT